MGALETWGLQQAGKVVDAGMGLLLEGHNDKRQLRQQDKLTAQQVKYQKEMADYNQQLQFDMWNKTNYKAQVEHLKEAGLNPALMYGMGGGGGVTTGSGASTSVGGGHAPGGGGEIMGLLAGSNLAMTQAQIENIKADTKKKEAETGKTAGVDTELAQTQISKLIAETTSEGLKQDLTKVETRLKELDNYITEATSEDVIDKAGWLADTAKYELDMAETKNYIQKATKNAVIDEIRATAVGALLRNSLIRAQTENTSMDTAQKEATIQKIKSEISLNNQAFGQNVQKLMIGWDSLSQDQKETRIRDQMAQYNTDPQRGVEKMVTAALDELMGRLPRNKTTTRETFNDGQNQRSTTTERY